MTVPHSSGEARRFARHPHGRTSMRLKGKVALITGAAPRYRPRHRRSIRRRRRRRRRQRFRQLAQAEDVAAGDSGERPTRRGGKSRRRQTRRRRADDRQGLEGARADRHPRQQRRHRDDRAVSRADRRAVDAAGRRQPARRVALLAGLLPARDRGQAARAASSTSDRFRRRRCCRDARTMRRRSSASRR